MVGLRSLKAKSIIFIILIMLVPMIIIGVAGILYYHSIIQENVQNDFLEDARSMSQLTDMYIDKAMVYLEMQAGNDRLIDTLARGDTASLNDQTRWIDSSTYLFNRIFITDTSGNVLSGDPADSDIGMNESNMPFITRPLKTGKTFISSPITDPATGKPTLFIGTPVYSNGTPIGVLVGGLDEELYLNIIYKTKASSPLENVIIVNETGHVILHNNKEIMRQAPDISGIPAIGKLVNGQEGTEEYDNPIQGGRWLGAYTPMRTNGWGTLISLPIETAYKPVNDSLRAFLVGLLLLTFLATCIALVVASYITSPIARISAATNKVGEGVDLARYLPYDRGDELGQLARSFKDMSDRIMDAREKISGEKKRADLYIDVMGHDINNYNQVILANLEMLGNNATLNNMQKEYLEGAIEAVKDSANLIKNVKTIQVASAGQIETQAIDLDEILKKCINSIHIPENKKVNIDYKPRQGIIVNVAPSIITAFYNVLENSIKHSGPEVDVRINVAEIYREGKKSYETTIIDNGFGIPDSVRETLFSRFRQSPTELPGKGLGLYTAKVLVERFGGRLQLENRVPGDHTKGIKVVITLPAAEA